MGRLYCVILLVMLSAGNVLGQIDIKGFVLGEKGKIEGDYISTHHMINSQFSPPVTIEGQKNSLVGESYFFTSKQMSDGRICKIEAFPVDGNSERMVNLKELSLLKKAIERKYKVNLNPIKSNSLIFWEGLTQEQVKVKIQGKLLSRKELYQIRISLVNEELSNEVLSEYNDNYNFRLNDI